MVTSIRKTIRKILLEKKKKDDPCWDDYEMVGTKKKGGKEVPNCVPMGDETDEGNAFSGARQEAIDNNEDEFEVDGKKYDVEGSKKKSFMEVRRLVRKILLEAIYNGRKVKLNSPSSNTENPKKKSKVYVDSGKKVKSGEHKGEIKAKKVQFGDPNMRIKKSNPKRRKSFRARHNCENPGPKTKARYWSCKAW